MPELTLKGQISGRRVAAIEPVQLRGAKSNISMREAWSLSINIGTSAYRREPGRHAPPCRMSTNHDRSPPLPPPRDGIAILHSYWAQDLSPPPSPPLSKASLNSSGELPNSTSVALPSCSSFSSLSALASSSDSCQVNNKFNTPPTGESIYKKKEGQDALAFCTNN